MPLFHCDDCGHEWEGLERGICDWCGSQGNLLEEETPLERLCKEIVNESKTKKTLKDIARSSGRNKV